MGPQPSEDDDVVAALFLTFVVLPVVAYFLLGKLHTLSELRRRMEPARREKEDALISEIMEYFIPTNSLMNLCDVERDTEDFSRAGITEYLIPPTSSRNVCAVCNRPTNFKRKQCKAVKYCSFKCQIKHWREGHKDECKKRHDNGSRSYGGPATEASQHMPLLRNLNSPLGDSGGIHLHDISLSESSFPATDSYSRCTDPVPTERTNMNKSNQSTHTLEHHALIGVPSEILLVNKVSDSSNFSYSDRTSGNCDVNYPVNAHQPSICAPDVRKRKNASITVSEPDMDVNLTSDMIRSCEGAHASSTEPLLRSFKSGISIEHEGLEQLLTDTSAKAIMLSYAVLKDITNNFSEVIGGGGSGEVYMIHH